MRTIRTAAPIVALALALGACTTSAATTAPTAAPTVAPSEAAPSEAAQSPAAGATIDLASTSLGTILVGDGGRTLYVFTPDAGGTSTCYDQCQASWPPLTSDSAPSLGAGLTAADFGTSPRTDGSTQITFHGMPLYYFAGDTAAGDTNGQGLSDKWFVVDANGQMIGANGGSSPAANGGVSIKLADSAFGSILADGDGRTLYLFTADGGGTSNCSGQCLDNWPALTTNGSPMLGDGLDAEDFGTIARAETGANQVTFYGHPLYYFAGDTAAGDTNGQGLSGKWYVVNAEGQKVEQAAAAPTSQPRY